MTQRSIFGKRANFCLFTFGLFLLLAVLIGGAETASAQQTWYLKVGAESHSAANQADAFLPNEIWIYAGDSIQWTWQPKNEPHTVSFLFSGQTRPTPPPPIGPPAGPPVGCRFSLISTLFLNHYNARAGS